ncbi:MAG: PEP-CTERM sorting domain-containing protein [Sedimentisphaerales bacterium]|nr:PEP-CTERM sorting domain-containing protein [Sedimentisphaerales bacterium]
MKKRFFNIIAVCLLCLSLVSFAGAEIITIEVTGVVNLLRTGGGFEVDGSVEVGSEMVGFCTYDTETPDLESSEYYGTYELISIFMTIGNYTFAHNQESTEIPIFRVGAADFGYAARSLAPSFEGSIIVDGFTKTYHDSDWGYIHIALMDLLTTQPIQSDELPTSLPDISVFDLRREFEARFHEPYPTGDGYFDIYGELTSLNLIPEPATIFLFGLAGLILTIKRPNSDRSKPASAG